jgi:exodeoxyribonuclease V beta subunit
MQDHHYYLQYHLYVTALHHHLKARRTDYTYEQHFGGVYYLFLRGMSPRHPPQAGIYHARPEQALILALSDLFDSKPEFAQ